MTEADLDDLVQRFDACAVPRREWTHTAHLAVGLWYAGRHGADAALERLRSGIRRLNESNGVENSATNGYHETVTCAYVRLLAAFAERHAEQPAAQRLELLLESALAERSALLVFYSRERLESSQARLAWLEPDLCPLSLDAALARARSVTTAVLFDLGNTLAAYYRRDEFLPILERAITGAREHLLAHGRKVADFQTAMSRAVAENREAADFRFAPLADRLARIFDVEPAARAALDATLCELFLRPIFEAGRAYPDAHGALERLRRDGYRTAIVSNAPWGSPPALWRKELARLGFTELVDAVVLCGDVGWRKPAKRIFDHACERLGVAVGECAFVGDELDWDVAGSAAAGMRPVLIDRDDRHPAFAGERIRSLTELGALFGPRRRET